MRDGGVALDASLRRFEEATSGGTGRLSDSIESTECKEEVGTFFSVRSSISLPVA